VYCDMTLETSQPVLPLTGRSERFFSSAFAMDWRLSSFLSDEELKPQAASFGKQARHSVIARF